MALQFSFDAIGTKWVIDIYDAVSKSQGEDVEKAVRARIEEFESTYSRFRPHSWLNFISTKEGRHKLPDDAEPLFSLYKELYDITDGLVTPLIGQILVDAGYDKDYSFKQKKELERPLAWDDAISYEPPFITIKKPVHFDLGALGKGYLIDIVGRFLEERGIKAYCVDAGRDILHKNEKGAPLRIGLEHPDDFKKIIGVASVKNQSIAGSAGNRRTWGKFNHIINPKTLSSPKDIIAIWAIAKSALLADAMTTALFFAPAAKLAKSYDFEYVILHSDFSVERSPASDSVIELYSR